MKRKFTTLLLIALLGIGTTFGQKTITVNASNSDISDNLDLEAVAYLFGEAKNLEEFEQMLNDPEKQLSNLDLNADGYVDYLRVIETNEDGIYLVIIQAVLGEDIFQNVASIDIDARDRNDVRIQVVGNEYIYGVNYIFEPVYVHRPYVCDYFWYPNHTIWYSPYYWSYYPVYYHHRKPHKYYTYHHHIYNHYHKMDCRYVQERKHTGHIHKEYQRNDYQKKYPEQAFNRRNADVQNRNELVSRRSSSPNVEQTRSTRKDVETKSRKVEKNWNSSSSDKSNERSTRRSSTRESAVPKSVTTNTNYKKPRNETRSVERSTRNNSSNSSSNRREYSAPKTTTKSVPIVTKKAESRSSNNNRSVSSSSERKPATVSKSRSESKPTPKPAVRSSNSSNKSSSKSNSKPSLKPQRSSSSGTSSSTPKSRNTSSGSSSKSSEKSKSSSRR